MGAQESGLKAEHKQALVKAKKTKKLHASQLGLTHIPAAFLKVLPCC